MRSLALVSAFAVIGCAGNSLPIDGQSTTGASSTNGGTNGGSTTAGTTNGGTTNGGTNGTTNGGSTGTGGQGDPCKSACDCTPGLACFMNQCQAAPMGINLYCCDAGATCPDGSYCQGSDGMFGQCGGSGGTTGTTGFTGGNNGGTTGSGGSCTSACDCPTGQACFNGGCVTPPMGIMLYCCDDPTSCPSGSYCQSSSGGGIMMCGGGTGGTTGFTGGTGGTTGTMNMCMATKCMTNADCTAAGCSRCSMRSGTCR